MSEKVETVEVTLKLPKPVYEFYKALATFHKKNLESLLEETIIGDIDFRIDDPPRGTLVRLYGLENYSEIQSSDL